MTFTYEVADLATSELFQIRLEIGDTAETTALLQDEEIEQAIAVEQNFWGAAARCCEIISRSFLRKADVRIGRGGTSLTYSKAAQQYTDMAAAFRARANATNAPWTGGTSKSEKDSLAADTDKVQPIFTKTLQNNTFGGQQSNDSVIEDDQEEFQ